jgi:hypothetical protein
LFATAVTWIANRSRNANRAAAGEGAFVVFAYAGTDFFAVRCTNHLAVHFDGQTGALLVLTHLFDAVAGVVIVDDRCLTARAGVVEFRRLATRKRALTIDADGGFSA